VRKPAPPGRRGPPSAQRPHLAKDEIRYHGTNACVALWQMRPSEIIRVYVLKDKAEDFSALLEFCAENRKSYHLVGEGDLERLTDTKHHDGICMVARERPTLRGGDLLREIGGGRTLVLYLDGVGNPHNLGAILRTAAHFGIRYVAGPAQSLPRVSPSANRTSEGGAEHVTLVRVEDPPRFFLQLKEKGFQAYAFDLDESAVSLFDTRMAERAVFILGAEVTGVTESLRRLADVTVKIPGTGAVESLNVSVASALAMAEFQRQGTQKTVRFVKKNPVP
jgi:RNA methyltransferase, TrmH family